MINIINYTVGCCTRCASVLYRGQQIIINIFKCGYTALNTFLLRFFPPFGQFFMIYFVILSMTNRGSWRHYTRCISALRQFTANVMPFLPNPYFDSGLPFRVKGSLATGSLRWPYVSRLTCQGKRSVSRLICQAERSASRFMCKGLRVKV